MLQTIGRPVGYSRTRHLTPDPLRKNYGRWLTPFLGNKQVSHTGIRITWITWITAVSQVSPVSQHRFPGINEEMDKYIKSRHFHSLVSSDLQ